MMLRHDKFMRYSRGFTLVELLVVISIFAILSSLLMGQLKNMVSSSTKIACLNKGRTIMAGGMLYGNDHDDLLPYVNDQLSNVTWDDRLSVYLGGRDLTPAEQEFVYWQNEWYLDLLSCPNSSRAGWRNKSYTIIAGSYEIKVDGKKIIRGRANVATIYNYAYHDYPNSSLYKPEQRFYDIPAPSATAVISEYEATQNQLGRLHDDSIITLDRQVSWWDSGGPFSAPIDHWKAFGNTWKLHDLSVSYLFVDGHAEQFFMLDEVVHGGGITKDELKNPRGIWTIDPND